jgi:hypothetical protein
VDLGTGAAQVGVSVFRSLLCMMVVRTREIAWRIGAVEPWIVETS